MMDPRRWEQLESICFAALEREAPERGLFLDQATAGDPDLRQEAEDLLQHLEADPAFLERPVVDLAALEPPETEEPPIAGSIGPYRVVQRLGRGGMGEVYLAMRETEDIQQSVAIKVIRRGMDTSEVLQRFRLERRILASLHHPNIASLIDAAATEDGRPYFVMEYIEGLPITDYCDRRKLSVHDRLQLFRTVCGAVQHAHQNLIVHRDIKPRNIVVSEEGTAKLLDFGIGKVLAPSEALGPAVATRTEFRLLTPEYAAPEQITGGPVTTATDVYALGVLLYELLAGRHPFVSGSESLRDVERAILESTPSRPSEGVTRDAGIHRATDQGQLRRRLAGDLDNIVLKALRKEPDRRYPSAAALMDDIQRHLDGLPVSARPDTLRYRTRKFVGRNAGAVAAGIAVFLGLAATTVVSVFQSGRVAREAERARQERDKALEVRGFLMEMFGATGGSQAVGDTVTARQLLDLQAARLPNAYPNQPELKADMMEVLADGYDRLGLYHAAEPLATEALAIRRQVLGPTHPDVAASLNLAGWIRHELGKSKDAEPLLLEAAAIRRAAGEPYRVDLSRSLNDLGVIYNALARYPAAESTLAEALAIRRAAHGDDHRAVGITANNLAAAYYYQGKLADAIQFQAVALRALTSAVGPDHQRTILALGNLAAFKRAQGDLAAAEADFRDLVARQTRLQGRDHPLTARVVLSLASVLDVRGVAERDDRKLAEAETLFREALKILELKLGPGHPQVGQTLTQLGENLLHRGQGAASVTAQERGLAIVRTALGDAARSTTTALKGLAITYWTLGQRDAAIRAQRQATQGIETALGANHRETGSAQSHLCDLIMLNRGDAREAERLCSRAVATLAAGPESGHALRVARLRLANAHAMLGNFAIADSLLADIRATLDTGEAGRNYRILADSVAALLPPDRAN